MRYIYTFSMYLLTPFIVLRLYWKSRRLPAYRQRINERFFIGHKVAATVDVWLHAVSLGEAVAATPLIDALLAKQKRVLVTTMTPTGSQHVLKCFGEKVAHQYIPYDLPWCLRRFFKAYQPRVGVIMETELWPNVITQASRMNIPLVLVNARISDKAFKSYEKVDFIFKPLLNQFATILTQSEQDAKRFIALGAAKDLVIVAGNMKFDLQIKRSTNLAYQQLKESWGKERVVLIAASTHDDEEKQLLSRLPQLKKAIPGLLLLFAPRHPERFQAVYRMSQDVGFNTGLRSQPVTIGINNDVIVADTLGELLHLYQLSDYAFVGGSLVPIGGHNVLEPIAAQVPVFCGPYMNNSKSICEALCAENAMVMVQNADELAMALAEMSRSKVQRQQQIKNASAVLETNKGAVARCMDKINAVLNRG